MYSTTTTEVSIEGLNVDDLATIRAELADILAPELDMAGLSPGEADLVAFEVTEGGYIRATLRSEYEA